MQRLSAFQVKVTDGFTICLVVPFLDLSWILHLNVIACIVSKSYFIIHTIKSVNESV